MFGKDEKKAAEVEPPPSPPLPTHRGTPSIFRRFNSEPTASEPTIATTKHTVTIATTTDVEQPDKPLDEALSPSFLRRLTGDIASPSLLRKLNHRLQDSDTSHQSDEAVTSTVHEAAVSEVPVVPTVQDEVPITAPGPITTPSLFRRVSESLWSSPRPQRRAEQASGHVSEQVEVEFAPKEGKKGYSMSRSMSNLSLFKERKKRRRRKKDEEEIDLSKEDVGFGFLASSRFVNTRYKDTSLIVYKGWKKQVIAQRKENRELPQDENYSVSVLKKTEDKPGCEVM